MHRPAKGSRKNKFAMVGVEAPVRQDVKTQAYLSSVAFSTTPPAGMHRLLNCEVIFLRALKILFEIDEFAAVESQGFEE
jgi:hypothetical protein